MPSPLRAKDKASAQLASGISAATLSIPLQAGQGSLFPAPFSGTATSSGTSSTLNSTGIGSSGVAVGDFIHNVTDDSWGRILTVSANSITTTKLKGGTANTWANTNIWRVNEFVVTAASVDAEGNDVTYEELLISGRSTDTLTVPSTPVNGRGYNSTTAQSFLTGDYIQLRVVAPYFEEIKAMVDSVNRQVDTNSDNIATNTSDITNQKTGTYHYVVSTGSSNAYVAATPALAALAAGNIVRFKANHTNSGASTLNVNGLGAVAIKKNDGATALAASDIISGQIVEVEYDGTNFQMLSPTGTPPTQLTTFKTVFASGASSATVSNPTSLTSFDTHTFTIPANDLAAGVGYEYEAAGTFTWGAGTFAITVKLGATDIGDIANLLFTPGVNGAYWYIKGMIMGTAAAGASVAVRHTYTLGFLSNTLQQSAAYTSTNLATNGTLALTFAVRMATSNGTNAAIATISRISKLSATPFA